MSIFDTAADAYDAWYDSPEGSAIFQEEKECLQLFCSCVSGRWLEVGAGTGRFAKALGCEYGIDLSQQMAVKAARRGVQVCVGCGEQLPLPEQCFEGVLMALTLCFLEDPEKALRRLG